MESGSSFFQHPLYRNSVFFLFEKAGYIMISGDLKFHSDGFFIRHFFSHQFPSWVFSTKKIPAASLGGVEILATSYLDHLRGLSLHPGAPKSTLEVPSI